MRDSNRQDRGPDMQDDTAILVVLLCLIVMGFSVHGILEVIEMVLRLFGLTP